MIWAGLPAYLQQKEAAISLSPLLCLISSQQGAKFFLVDVLKPKGSMDPASANFPSTTHLHFKI